MDTGFTAYVAAVFGVKTSDALFRIAADAPSTLLIDCRTAAIVERMLEQDVPEIVAAALPFEIANIDICHQGKSIFYLPVGLCLSKPVWINLPSEGGVVG